jgi:flavin reductase (DIM6/NTAB) family NADH-FMN oxidoreductase RutF
MYRFSTRCVSEKSGIMLENDFGNPMLSPANTALPPDFDRRHFRHALSQFATGITVITTRLEDGTLLGLTASSFNSVSLDPPLVLWSLGDRAQSLSIFTSNTHYVVNVLAADQRHLAEQFASRTENRFQGVEYTLSRTGLPILKGASAWFECFNRSRYPEGDHVIFVGEVEQCAAIDQTPLVFHQGQFLTSKAL